jgi:hypothetical protein
MAAAPALAGDVPARACPGMATTAAATAQAVPAGALNVRDFGARGDGRSDDTQPLRRALAALAPGQWLLFPPGQYVHSARLVVAAPRVTLHGYGATLHATAPGDQALLIQADGVRVLGFTLTAVTDRRRDAPWESRIAVWRHGRGLPALDRIEIRDNRIVESGEAGSALANSSSSAAIFVHNARHFVVAGNLVRRSLADAIHVTGGSRHGRVIGNTVRDSGDDMVAVVSYLGSDFDPGVPMTLRGWNDRREAELVRDILIADNDLSGQYWGRGISVVGGEDVTIAANAIDATTHAAAVYIARETSFNTFGVRNVRVQGNRITRVQTEPPAYDALPWPQRGRRTGHGAVQLVAQRTAAELRQPLLREALTVREVAIEGNDIDRSATTGIGLTQAVDRVALRHNALRRITGDAIALRGAEAVALHCRGNTRDGRALTHPRCGAEPVRVSGAAQGCAAAF